MPYFFQSKNVSKQAKDSQNISSGLNKTATLTEDKVNNELTSALDEIKRRLELIRAKIRNVSSDLSDVESNFPEFDKMASLIGKSCCCCCCCFFF